MIKMKIDTTAFSGMLGDDAWERDPCVVFYEYAGVMEYAKPFNPAEVHTNMLHVYDNVFEVLHEYINYVMNNHYIGCKMEIVIQTRPICAKCDKAFEQSHLGQDKCDDCILVECEKCGSYYPYSENSETTCNHCKEEA